jgi:outer membrane protein assembly factor BamE (lipoprotein component of BamABCDE complex)
MRGRRRAWPLLILFVLSCSYAKGPPYVVDGRLFHDDKVGFVRKGMPAEKVRELLGDPLDIKREDGLERWRYYVWQRQDETIRYLGLIPARRPLYSGAKEATILFKDGVVQEVQFQHLRFD